MHAANESPTRSISSAPTSPAAPGQAASRLPQAASPGSAAPSDSPRDRLSPGGLPRSLHATYLRALCRSAVGGHPDHGLSHDPQSAAYGRCLGPRPSLQLPPCLLAPTVFAVASGPGVGGLPPAPLGPPRDRVGGRRRYRGRTQRQVCLRQGAAPRCRTFEPLLHRFPLGAQVGGPGHPGPLPLRDKAVGLARPGRAVSLREGQPAVGTAAQDASGIAAATAGGLV